MKCMVFGTQVLEWGVHGPFGAAPEYVDVVESHSSGRRPSCTEAEHALLFVNHVVLPSWVTPGQVPFQTGRAQMAQNGPNPLQKMCSPGPETLKFESLEPKGEGPTMNMVHQSI